MADSFSAAGGLSSHITSLAPYLKHLSLPQPFVLIKEFYFTFVTILLLALKWKPHEGKRLFWLGHCCSCNTKNTTWYIIGAQ